MEFEGLVKKGYDSKERRCGSKDGGGGGEGLVKERKRGGGG